MILSHRNRVHASKTLRSTTRAATVRWLAALAVSFALSILIPARAAQISQPPSQIKGTALDVNGDPVVGATVILASTAPADRQTLATPENGVFQFDGLPPGVPYHLPIRAPGFADWKSPTVTVDPGQIKMLGAIQL